MLGLSILPKRKLNIFLEVENGDPKVAFPAWLPLVRTKQ